MASSGLELGAQIITNLFLFFLVMGMASTVDIRDMRRQIRNVKAVSIGLFCQFILLPFLGYCIVMIFGLPPTIGITLIIVVSSPGGSYSNWWCSLLNADLALSVSMTTASTILSIGFLPLNMFIYTYAAYGQEETYDGESVMESISFSVIFISLGIVIAAIFTGIFCSWKFDTPRWHRIAYLGGNISGILLILFSTILSFVGGGSSDQNENQQTTTTGEDVLNYFAISLPCLFGLLISTLLATFLVKLSKPERLTTAVECCYQNTGIATSAALGLFSGDDLQEALKVPVVYGFVEIFFIGIYLLIFWKLGWSKAPKNEKCCTVITKSYELHEDDEAEVEPVEEIEPEQIETMWNSEAGPIIVGESGGSDDWKDDNSSPTEPNTPVDNQLEREI